MTEYDAKRPFSVWCSEAVGSEPMRFGARSRTESYPTLEEARVAAKCLPDGSRFARITDGPDHQLIQYRLEP
jgi:hypothetical protein